MPHRSDLRRAPEFAHLLLRAGRLTLLMPRDAVSELTHRERPGAPCVVAADPRVDLALDEDLRVLGHLPAQRFLSTRFYATGALRWHWDDLRILMQRRVQLVPMPAVLGAPEPLTHYAQLDGDMVFAADPAQLHAFVARRAPLEALPL